MLPASEGEVQLEVELAALRVRLQHRTVESLDLAACLRVEDYQPGPPPPGTLAGDVELRGCYARPQPEATSAPVASFAAFNRRRWWAG